MRLNHNKDLYLFDGFPIPTCHIKRIHWKNPFKGLGAVGYCAAKDLKYFGFKGHLLISTEGVTRALSIAPANKDERDVLSELSLGFTGDIIADKGLIRPSLEIELKTQGITLHTPKRRNMKGSET